MPITGDGEDVEFREEATATEPQKGRAQSAAARSKARRRRARRVQADTRRIGLQHLAFFRGYLEGLDLAELADQYLEFGHDARRAMDTRNWLAAAFVAAARKRQDFATARLLSLHPSALTNAVAPAITGPWLLWRNSRPLMIRTAFTRRRSCSIYSPPSCRRAARSERRGRGYAAPQRRNARLRVRQMAASAAR